MKSLKDQVREVGSFLMSNEKVTDSRKRHSLEILN